VSNLSGEVKPSIQSDEKQLGLVADSNELGERQRALARDWYGYGQWSAPYWFVGIEPGGDELDANVKMWDALGGGELVDIAAHHGEHDRDWFSESASRPQATWQKLIWLLHFYKGDDPAPRSVLAYQKRRLGRANDETALLEISALAAIDNNVVRPRLLYRQHRIDVIRERMLAYVPQFVVFYSPDNRPERLYVDAWNAIAGTSLQRDVPVMVGRTACVMTYHPNYKRDKQYWSSIAASLKAAREASS
jgi:hypothetical protein